MGDWYTQDPSRLEGQPKRAIADYVESQGIVVPRRFRSLQEAKASGLPIFVRSEHPQEYNGVSGLLESRLLKEGKEVADEQDLKKRLLVDCMHEMKSYCSLLGKDIDQFKEEVSFSYWEFMSGLNRVIVADSAIKGRYHILVADVKDGGYVLIENGKIIQQIMTQDKGNNDLEKLIGLYEGVRNLDRFDANHCPLLETITVDGRIYFLQYHRTRDFQEAAFTIEREPVKNEIEARFVRGATPPEGEVYTVTTRYPAEVDYGGWKLSTEDGSLDICTNKIFSELMVRRRKIQVIIREERDLFFYAVALGHFERSKVFKPMISVLVEEGLYPDAEDEKAFRKIWDKVATTPQTIQVKVIADGRRAFLERVD